MRTANNPARGRVGKRKGVRNLFSNEAYLPEMRWIGNCRERPRRGCGNTFSLSVRAVGGPAKRSRPAPSRQRRSGKSGADDGGGDKAGLSKRATSHSTTAFVAAHLIEDGYGILPARSLLPPRRAWVADYQGRGAVIGVFLPATTAGRISQQNSSISETSIWGVVLKALSREDSVSRRAEPRRRKRTERQ